MGEYQPESSLRRAHQAKLTLGSPGDVYEQEADSVARAFSRWELQPGGGQGTGRGLQRQPIPEEEKKKKGLMTKPMDDPLRRQPEEEKKKEEPLRTQLETSELQRQPEEEEKKPV
jgi:hypothetical protein